MTTNGDRVFAADCLGDSCDMLLFWRLQSRCVNSLRYRFYCLLSPEAVAVIIGALLTASASTTFASFLFGKVQTIEQQQQNPYVIEPIIADTNDSRWYQYKSRFEKIYSSLENDRR